MQTYALVIAIWTAVSGRPEASDELIADHHLTQADCQAYVETYTPTVSKMPAGLTISTTALCREETP